MDERGQMRSLSEFHPSVGIPTALAAHLKRVRVDAARVVCVENLTAFYELVRHEGGKLTAEAKAIYEAILENGPLDTVRLRREARMSAESAKSRFDRALVELQVGLKVLPIGVARTGAWNSPTSCSTYLCLVHPLQPVWGCPF